MPEPVDDIVDMVGQAVAMASGLYEAARAGRGAPPRLIDRWDVDPVTRTALPFDRAMALLNLRRAELACVLELLTDVF